MGAVAERQMAGTGSSEEGLRESSWTRKEREVSQAVVEAASASASDGVASEFRHVPAWLARRQPAVAALETNPLFLRMSGRAYGRRRWLGCEGGRWWWGSPLARVAFPGLVVSFVLGTLLFSPVAPILLLIACLAPWGSLRAWRLASSLKREARSGRLLDLYLSMTAQEIADAVVACAWAPGRTRTSVLWWTSALSWPLVTMGAWVADSVAWGCLAAGLGVVTVGWPVAILVEIGRGYVTLAEAVRLSGNEMPWVSFCASALWRRVVRIGAVLLSLFCFFLFLGICAEADTDGLATVTVATPSFFAVLFGIVYLVAESQLPQRRRKAIAAMADGLAAILEANPATEEI